MNQAMIRRQIIRYTNDAVRFKAKADRAYAAFKGTGNKYKYLNSQRYYAAAQQAQEIAENYRRMLSQVG